jgi:hypothetical protein
MAHRNSAIETQAIVLIDILAHPINDGYKFGEIPMLESVDGVEVCVPFIHLLNL